MIKKLKGWLMVLGAALVLLATYIITSVVFLVIQFTAVVLAGGAAAYIAICSFLFYKRLKASE